MSATPRPFIGDAKSLRVFAALLAIARAADQDGCCDTSGACEGAEAHGQTGDAVKALDNLNPDWRTWTP